MATSRYEVVYADGTKRTKLLSSEDAKKLEEAKGVKSLKPAENKQRGKAANKGE